MDAIRLQNLRSLEDTGFIELKPLTILLGKNSSGKSTFLRSFLLLRQSVESRTKGPILWYGHLTDFGTFTDALNKNSKNNDICFSFRFTLDQETAENIAYGPFHVLNDIDIEFSVTVGLGAHKDSAIATKCEIKFFSHSVTIKLDGDGNVEEFIVNGRDLTPVGSQFKMFNHGSIVPQLTEIPRQVPKDVSSVALRFFRRRRYLFMDTVLAQMKSITPRLGQQKLSAAVHSFCIGTSEEMLSNVVETPYGGQEWKGKTRAWATDSEDFLAIQDAVIGHHVVVLLQVIDEYVTRCVRKTMYTAPLRATAERYYRIQDLSVDEVDPQGRNLAMFIKNLTETERRSFAEWSESHFGFSPQIRTSGGHVSLKLKEASSSQEFNLADMGFGFSQILPILTQLWTIGHKKPKKERVTVPITFAIEQPELHLHPKMQAQLADVFMATIKAGREVGIDIKLLIETHSETLVNRIGHRIQSDDFNPADVNVLIFEKDGPVSSTRVSVGGYSSDGYLENWPYGFFEPEVVK